MKGYKTAKQRAWQNQNNQTATPAAPTPIAPVVAAPTAATKVAGKKGSKKQQGRLMTIVIIITVVIVLVTVGVLIWWFNRAPSQPAPSETTAATTAAETVTKTAEDKVIEDLISLGWSRDQFLVDDEVKRELDESTTGEGAFNLGGFRSNQEVVDFVGGGTDQANALVMNVFATTGDGREVILDQANWVVIQALGDFIYPNNSGYIDNKLTELGVKKGGANDIFVAFVSPSGKIVYFRGACANPQLAPPIPETPKVTPTPTTALTPTPTPTTTLTPKDPKKDPAAQGNAPVGSGVNQDPGPGAYVAPTDMVTPPAESRINPTPPVATVPTTATTTAAATTAKTPVATPTPTPVDVAVGDPTSVGTPAIPN